MYDISKRQECKKMQVWEAIEILRKMPLNAIMLFNGDEYGYIHIEEDESAISFGSLIIALLTLLDKRNRNKRK